MDTISLIRPDYNPDCITANGCIDLIYHMPLKKRKSLKSLAVSPLTLQDIRKLKDGQGRYLCDWGVLSSSTSLMFLGIPVEEDDNLNFGDVVLNNVDYGDDRCAHCGTKTVLGHVNCIACGAP